MCIGQFIYRVEEGQNFSVILKETYYGLVKSGEFLVRLIAARIVRAATIEDISSSVAAVILGNAFVKREGKDLYHQRTLAVIF